MNVFTFIQRQISQIKKQGSKELVRKVKLFCRLISRIIFYFLFGIISVPFVLIIRLIRPWLLVRISPLRSDRIGHFVLDIETYLCEQDANINIPEHAYVDLFYMGGQISNKQLAKMWKRILPIWPRWVLAPIVKVNRMLPGAKKHDALTLAFDIHNLLDRFHPHVHFTEDEEKIGKEELKKIGIPPEAKFVCLIVRDSSYLENVFSGNWSYQNYRDCDIQNFVLAAQELADRGYYIIRMGVIVNQTMKVNHPKIIDYASNGLRTDFMDIYLGSKCEFCISTGTGWDMIPAWLFKKPVVFTNLVPLAYLPTYSKNFLLLAKRHYLVTEERELSLTEIITSGAAYSAQSSEFESKNIRLLENSPKEIRDVSIEMSERLKNTWVPGASDELLQQRFWEIYPSDAVAVHTGEKLHGKIFARYGANFLRDNPDWLS